MRSKNALIFYLTVFLRDITFYQAVAVIIAKEYFGFTYQQTFFLGSLALIINVLCQIPTGAFADKYGRKLSYFVGTCLLMIDGIIPVFTKNFYWIAAAFAIQGVGLSLMSGAMQALAMHWLKDIDQQDQYKRLSSNVSAVSYWSRAVGSVFSGFLYVVHPVLGKFLTALTSFISGFLILTFTISSETEFEEKENSNVEFTKQGTLSFFATLKKSPEMINVLIAVTLLAIISNIAWNAYQPYFTSFGLSPQLIGIIYTIIAAISSISTLHIKKIKTDKTEMQFISYLLLGNIAVATLLLIPNVFAVIGGIFLLSFLFGYHAPLKSSYFDQKFPAAYRTTCLSILSIINTLAYVVNQSIDGYLLDHFPLHAIAFVLGGGSLLTLAWITFVARNNKVNNANKDNENSLLLENN